MNTYKKQLANGLLILLGILGMGSSFANASVGKKDTLINTTIYARQINQVRIKLGNPCSPCAVYWTADGQGKKLLANVYGAGNDTVKIQYDFQEFNSLKNSITIYEGHYLRSTLPFKMDYPIPEGLGKILPSKPGKNILTNVIDIRGRLLDNKSMRIAFYEVKK